MGAAIPKPLRLEDATEADEMLLVAAGLGDDGLPADFSSAEDGSGGVGEVNEGDLIFGEGEDFGALGVGEGSLGLEDIGSSSQADFILAFLGLVESAVEDCSLSAGETTAGLPLLSGFLLERN